MNMQAQQVSIHFLDHHQVFCNRFVGHALIVFRHRFDRISRTQYLGAFQYFRPVIDIQVPVFLGNGTDTGRQHIIVYLAAFLITQDHFYPIQIRTLRSP